MTTMTVAPVQKRHRFRLNRPRHEGKMLVTVRDWHMRQMRRHGDVAYTRPAIDVQYEPSRLEWHLYVTWDQALLPVGYGLWPLPPAGWKLAVQP